MASNAVLRVRGLKKYFSRKAEGKTIRAVDNVSFNIKEGEFFGIVGELGSGKTTLAYTITRIYEPTAGKVYLDGQDIFELGKKELRKTRAKMQLIFSNPYTSLNPRLTLNNTLKEALTVNNVTKDYDEIRRRILEMLENLGLKEDQLYRFPHEFSGGQRQRIAIARALIVRPKVLIADEPVIALDTSVKASILNLFKRLKKSKLSCLIISNSFGVVSFIADRTAVMCKGKIVEMASTEELVSSPLHPYTQHLLSILPIPDPDFKLKPVLKEEFTPTNSLQGCKISKRCPDKTSKCEKEEPELIDVGNGHYVACHLAD